MPVKYVLLDLLCNHIGIALKCGIELGGKFGGYLVAYMYQLTEIRIVKRILLVVSQRTGVLVTVPRCYQIGRAHV